MRSAVWIGTGIIVLCASACGDDVSSQCLSGEQMPTSWELSADGIRVQFSSSPYSLTVAGADGRAVLSTANPDPDGGYSTLAYSDGRADYDIYISHGYSRFDYLADRWHGDLEVVSAQESSEELTLTLRSTSDPSARCIEVVHSVEASKLRVQAAVRAGDMPTAWATAWNTTEDEGFLGFGERFNRTDQRGVDVYSWAEEGGLGDGEGTEEGLFNPFPNGEAMSYYPVPFFLSTEGYGFWLDTNHRSEFNLATSRDDSWRAWHLGSEMAFEIYLPVPQDERPWPYHIIDRFTEATGRPMLPPAWSFGPRRRISRSYLVDDVPEIQAMRDEDLAITAVDDSMHFYPAGHHVGRESDLADWVKAANALGYKVNGYYNSFVDQDPDGPLHEHAAEGVSRGYFLKLRDGSYPGLWILTGGSVLDLYLVDFTSEAATRWYQDSFAWATELGYSGWMYDFGEYVPPDAIAADGTTGEELHNLYPVLYAKAAHDALESGPLAGDWLAFMRSGYTGSSAYTPMVWTGDPAASFEESDGLPSMVPASLNLGVSGVPHSGGDIGGFHCVADGAEAADEELLTRWIQQGAASSNMQDQNACVGGDGAAKASIWSAPAARQAWKTYARLHTRLFPYLYTLAHEATATGAPTMRHVFLEHPDRVDLRAVDDAYYLGPALYVAPVLRRGDRQKVVQLPAGPYLDWHDHSLVDGGQAVTLDAPLDRLPLLLRANHLVPLLDASIDTLAPEDKSDIVGPQDVGDVYDVIALLTADASAAYALYDGNSLSVAHTGAEDSAGLSPAAGPEELIDCDGCYLVEPGGDGVARLRISTALPSVTLGGVRFDNSTDRRVRWDLTLDGRQQAPANGGER